VTSGLDDLANGHSTGTAVSQMGAMKGRRPRTSDGQSAGLAPAPRPARRLVGLDDAATMLGVSIWTVREMVYRGDLPTVKLPRVRRFLLDLRDLEALITASKQE
jgi:hypothetical protein